MTYFSKKLFPGLLILTGCFSGDTTWTPGLWSVAEYSYTKTGDECQLAADLESLGSAFTYRLSAPLDRSDPNYNPNEPEDTGDTGSNDIDSSGRLSDDSVAAGQADLWSVCSSPEPSFQCNFVLEMVHQDLWLNDFIEKADCADGTTPNVQGWTEGLMINEDELLTSTRVNLRCKNDTTNEESSICTSEYSTRLRAD